MFRIKPEFGRGIRKIPVIGIKQTGKTYFFFTLVHIVSDMHWGEVADTKLFINKVEIGEESIPCNFYVYTEDFGGAEFEELMKLLSRGKHPSRLDQQDLLIAFTNLIKNAAGVIVIIDVARQTDDRGNLVDLTADEFRENKEKIILNSLSQQVVPLTKALEMVIERNPRVRGKPIFLVFTKYDVHRMKGDEIKKYVTRFMAINLERLARRGFIINWYSVASFGFGGETVQGLLTQFGYAELLRDIAHFLSRRR